MVPVHCTRVEDSIVQYLNYCTRVKDDELVVGEERNRKYL